MGNRIYALSFNDSGSRKKGLLDKVVVNIQGLLGIYAIHYANDLPDDVVEKEVSGKSIRHEIDDFRMRSEYEKVCLEKAKHVIGRTTWDYACVKQINPGVCYHFCNEILREIFYEKAGSWQYEACEKHTIFISQASYSIKGLEIIKKQFPYVKVYVAGKNLAMRDTAYAEFVLDEIGKRNLTENIVFLGMLTEEEMCEYYKKCNVFVSASVIENSPNSVCEASMIGIPIVASNVGGVSDLITHIYDGYLYPYDEYYMMAYYVLQIFENGNQICNKLSNNSMKEMLKINSISNNSTQNLKIYKHILKEV